LKKKMAVKAASKITLTHPQTGTQMQVDAVLYLQFEKAILQSLRGSKGKIFTELATDVKKIIQKRLPSFKGSHAWYTISVRLDLESRGRVETYTEKGRKYNRLTPVSKKQPA
jgi:hypothetical protein